MIAAGVDDEALVVPGGIKRNDRIAYKSAVNYNGRYDQCKVGPQLPPPNPLSVWGYYCTRATCFHRWYWGFHLRTHLGTPPSSCVLVLF